jgi:hypothetical protein
MDKTKATNNSILTSMTPRSSVEQNVKVKMASGQKDATTHDATHKSNNSDDGFDEFLKVISSSDSAAKAPTESVATTVS